jgi:hypothetical protein
MRKALLISLFLLWPAAAPATETGQCDAKPFTLAKPAVSAPKAKIAPPKVRTAAAPAVKSAPKARRAPVVGCKQPPANKG